MRIEDRFAVPLPVEDAWTVLLDLERIAPCMPGAQLQEVEGDEHRGVVKVKLGAITAQFKGVARFTEVDEAARRVVLRAEGREMRGQGNAAATVTASLHPAAAGHTDVVLETDLSITGRMAQFGRGVLADVSSKLLGEFARCLEADLLGGEVARAAAPATAAAAEPAHGAPGQVEPADPAPAESVPTVAERPERRVITGPDAEPVDLLAVAGPSVGQALVPAGIVVVLLLLALVENRLVRSVLATLGAGLVAVLLTSRQRSRPLV